MGNNRHECRVYDIGTIEYTRTLQLQNSLVSARLAHEIPDVILLLQHPSVLTIGTSGSEENIIVSKDILGGEGIPLLHVDRGGDITFHGPGQLVGYLIFDLKTQGGDIHQYVRDLEEVIILGLSEFSIRAHRVPQYPGVWVGNEKICPIGIRVSRWVTKHGFALNVSTDLKYFTYINPCGITNKGVTSMTKLLGHDIALGDVTSCILKYSAQVFDIDIRRGYVKELNRYL